MRTISVARKPASPWRQRLPIAGLALGGLLVLLWPTLFSMVSIWWRSETFAHGFLIFPISGYLVWRSRRELRRVSTHADFRATSLIALLVLVWTLARVADVLVVEQLAFVALVPVLAWLLLGWEVTRAMAFPLGFLFLAVPMGEALIPPMMDFTAVFTVDALRLSGIPVYWEGTFFSIPSGDWSVVEACSGVRYLIASVTLGFLYAYLMYRSPWRRAAFVLLATVAPVIANGFRAYLIVMIAHLSDMRLALGVDHLVYGWLFFGVVIFFLFWLGTFWREPDGARRELFVPVAATVEGLRRPMLALAAGLLVIGLGPAWAAHLRLSDGDDTPIALRAPAGHGAWQLSASPFTAWKPRYVSPAAELQQVYSNGDTPVGLYLAYYARQRQGAELVSSQNVMVEQKHPVWREVRRDTVAARLNGEPYRVHESRLSSARQDLLVWHWYWVAGAHMTDPYRAKLREAWKALLGKSRAGGAIVVYTPLAEEPEKSRAALQRYLEAMLPAIEAGLAQGKG